VPEYMRHPEWFITIWPLVMIALIITAGVLAVLGIAVGRSELLKAFLIVFSFSILGTAVGWMTGDSGDPVLSAVLPAVLSLVGGLGVYLIGHTERDSAIVAAGISALAINLLVATLISAQNARDYQQALAELDVAGIQMESRALDSMEEKLGITPENRDAKVANWSALLGEQTATENAAR